MVNNIVWFVMNLDDVRSDFSVYHRVDEVEALPAERFLSYAHRLHVYGGAVAVLAKQAPTVPVVSPPEPGREAPWNDITDALRTDPLFMGQGTYATVPGE